MGASASVLGKTELEELRLVSKFTDKELVRLKHRFERLDTEDHDKINISELKYVPELEHNPLLPRILENISKKRPLGTLTFTEFIVELAPFSANADKTLKMRFSFDLCDMDGDGLVSREDIVQYLKLIVKTTLTDGQLHQIGVEAIREADLDRDGKLSFDEYRKVVVNTDIESRITIRF